MQDTLYAILVLITITVTLYITYKHRTNHISIKQLFFALLWMFLFFIIVGSFTTTLCYHNTTLLLIEISILLFIALTTVQSKKIKRNIAMGLFLSFVALHLYFRSFVTGKEFTTSFSYIEDINHIREEKKNPHRLIAVPLWHTTFTDIYRVEEN
jgi:cell division protein FtsW (lipid II flippase)